MGRSWFGATRYNDKVFDYLNCADCRSLVCSPMPDGETLSKLYGSDYLAINKKESQSESPKDPEYTLRFLQKAERPGVFLDYGCGEGELLSSARSMGWEAIGFEYDPTVAAQVEADTGCRVVDDPSKLCEPGRELRVDVLHLGDVIEHLTDLEHQFPEILAMIKPGGYLLAQGPLEGGPNFFTTVLKWSRRRAGNPVANMPPYHVILATVHGQRRFFENHGLKQVAYRVTEEDWPAPSRPKRPVLSRHTALWGVRKFSQGLSLCGLGRLGNRYFYVGRKQEA